MNRKDAPGDNRRLYDRPLDDAREPDDPEAVDQDSGNLSGAALRADPYGEDITGIPPLEEEPHPDDILPDQLRRMPNAPEQNDEEITARPRDDFEPIRSEDLPEG
jgi:hypothetical protein